MTNYVLGFVFGKTKKKVILIKKLKPDWQYDQLNGLGGKVEETDNSMEDAMSRECEEECGLVIPHQDWYLFNTIKEPEATIFCFYTVVGKGILPLAHSRTDEIVGVYRINNLPESCLNNVPELIFKAHLAAIWNKH